MNPSFDLWETLNLVVWLLPLPFLGLALSGRGKIWWPGWAQIGSLSVLAALEVASQLGPRSGVFLWVATRQRLWNFLAGAFLQIALSEGATHSGWRNPGSALVRQRRWLATLFLPAGIVSALAWNLSIGVAMAFPWGAQLLFETLALASAPVLWVRVLRVAAATTLGASLAGPEAWLPFSIIASVLAATQALSRIRRDTNIRLQHARAAMQPRAIQELLAGTTGPRLANDDENLPLDRLDALLSFAIQSTGSSGGAVFLYKEEKVPEVGTLSRRLGSPLAKGSLKDVQGDAASLSAQVLLSLLAGADQARDIGPDGPVETYALNAFHSPHLAVAPIRSRGRTLGLVVLAPSSSRERFQMGDFHVLDFLAQQAVFSLHYEAVYHRLMEDTRLSREFEIASRIQKSLLPRSMPEVPGLALAARVLPAREVGGDYYDLLPLPDDRLLAVIGDVSGKGLPAGMIMLIVRTSLHLLVDSDPHANPSQLIHALEERLVPQLDAFTFMTFLALRWSARDHVLTWSGAGHEHILVRSAADGSIHRIRTGGLALGLQRESTPLREERRLPLSPGDTVVLYTDGVTDCRNSAGTAWGLDQLQRSLEKHGSESAESLVNSILSDLDAFRGQEPPMDDRTLVVFRAT
jgi:serine phosphatase RsbU (regulator of sigma subunit)